MKTMKIKKDFYDWADKHNIQIITSSLGIEHLPHPVRVGDKIDTPIHRGLEILGFADYGNQIVVFVMCGVSGWFSITPDSITSLSRKSKII